MSKLSELREQLGAIDRQILQLVSERQRLSRDIGTAKAELGLPTRDFLQERDVVERARAAALAAGLPAEFGERLSLLLIASSLEVQEQHRLTQASPGNGQRALIIGGCGLMGQWFARFLSASGHAIEVADPSAATTDGDRWRGGPGLPTDAITHVSWTELALDHDIIVVATPMAAANDILTALARRPPKGLVFDIASLKSPLRSGLQALRAAGGHVTSVHPMFGPNTALLSGRHVVIVDVGDSAANDKAKQLFAPTMATLVEMDLESHDRYMAYVLGLSHAVNIAFFTALTSSGETAPTLATLSSTTFDHQVNVAAEVARENPDLYFDIQAQNDYGSESLSALLLAVERIRSAVRANDRVGFAALMNRGREYFANRRRDPIRR